MRDSARLIGWHSADKAKHPPIPVGCQSRTGKPPVDALGAIVGVVGGIRVVSPATTRSAPIPATKLRGRVVWQAEGHHILRFHRLMLVGWPEGNHHEADESALTGRTAAVGRGATLCFGVPLLTADRTLVYSTTVDALDEVLVWLRRVPE